MKIIETEMNSEPSWATFGLTNEDTDDEMSPPSTILGLVFVEEIRCREKSILCVSRNECQEVSAKTAMVMLLVYHCRAQLEGGWE